MHSLDITAVLLRAAGLSTLVADQTFTSSINTLFGANGSKIIAVLALIAIIATDVIRVNTVPAQTKDSTNA